MLRVLDAKRMDITHVFDNLPMPNQASDPELELNQKYEVFNPSFAQNPNEAGEVILVARVYHGFAPSGGGTGNWKGVNSAAVVKMQLVGGELQNPSQPVYLFQPADGRTKAGLGDGGEDPRVFVAKDGSMHVLWNDNRYAKSTLGGNENPRHMFVAPFCPQSLKLKEESRLIDLAIKGKFEKNWSPFSKIDGDGSHDYILYQISPLKIFKMEWKSGVPEQAEYQTDPLKFLEDLSSGHPFLCGSTNGVPFNDYARPAGCQSIARKWLFAGHAKLKKDAFGGKFPGNFLNPEGKQASADWHQKYPTMYGTFFFTVSLENDVFTVDKISRLFQLPSEPQNAKITFPEGLMISGDDVFLSYGESDCVCSYVKITKQEVNELLWKNHSSQVCARR